MRRSLLELNSPDTFALLVPGYNATRFLQRLREQVDRLKPAFDEVLFADDASGDDTADRAEALGFTVIRLPRNLGPGGARNALARAATANWIHFHDVDDELAPNYLARVRPAAGLDRDAVLHFVDFIDEKTRALIVRWKFDPDLLAADAAALLLHGPMPTMSSLIRRETFLSVGGFNEELRCFEDGDLHFRLAAGGARWACVPEVLEWSLRHSQGAGSNQHYCLQCRLKFLEQYAATLAPRFREHVASEAEVVAGRLALANDVPAARRAIALCRSLGSNPPSSRHPIVRALKPFLPAHLLLRWQARRRQGAV